MRPLSLKPLLALVVGVAAVAVFTGLPAILPPFYIRVLQVFFFSAGLALSWGLLGGFAGYWSFGHTAFIGIGGFTAALVSSHLLGGGGTGWGMVVTVGAGGLVAALFALVLAYPLLRLRGIYFAIAMLGVGEVFSELSSSIDWIGGGLGLTLPAGTDLDIAPEVFYYYVFLVLMVAILLISAATKLSRFGYGLMSIREDEDTARMLGVPTERYKIQAFVLSAFLVGTLGAVYAYSLGYFSTPSLFRVDFSLNMIVHNMIGGIGTIAGPVIGAAIMVFLTNVVLGSFLSVHLLLTGALVVLIVLLAPTGLLGLAARLWQRDPPEEEPTSPTRERERRLTNEPAE
ncbi:branched-chain amino acid ABC transporter permease [Microvirga brassicacearum]|uniref:Branched-chain amino acid ABC transporter permease n=1 Tax=Microvirga brassicacearum TaxID=2580413 RepID=A0A5N3P6E5_9HYPH|nr:branched-chain amino acid ABC transporter permease [Microvirga brassicacearum]KAB0265308.1 branched-chain amino acid ABC transporter permease [Microvirga brassicacearum]